MKILLGITHRYNQIPKMVGMLVAKLHKRF